MADESLAREIEMTLVAQTRALGISLKQEKKQRKEIQNELKTLTIALDKRNLEYEKLFRRQSN